MRARVIALSILAFGCGSSPVRANECADNTGCSASQVCAQGICLDALSVQYALALSIDVAATEPDGTPWDSDGSPPDVEATMAPPADANGIPSGDVLNWGVQETFNARWSPLVAQFDQDVALTMAVSDSDTFGADAICSVTFPTAVSWLHAGGATVEGASCRVTLVAAPIPPP